MDKKENKKGLPIYSIYSMQRLVNTTKQVIKKKENNTYFLFTPLLLSEKQNNLKEKEKAKIKKIKTKFENNN